MRNLNLKSEQGVTNLKIKTIFHWKNIFQFDPDKVEAAKGIFYLALYYRNNVFSE